MVWYHEGSHDVLRKNRVKQRLGMPASEPPACEAAKDYRSAVKNTTEPVTTRTLPGRRGLGVELQFVLHRIGGIQD